MGILAYVAKRLLLVIPVFFGVITLTFLISHVIVPDPAVAWAGGVKVSKSTLEAIAAQYHLNDPLYEQYYFYIVSLLSGNWGTSPVTHMPVLKEIGVYFPATLELSIAALIISVAIGIPFGVLSALMNGRKLDYPLRVIYLAGISSPPFLLALVFQLLFSYYFKILPSSGQLSPTLTPPTHITGMYVLDSLLTANWTDFSNSLLHLIMPATALALLTFSIITRITRSSMLETMNKDFIRTAKSKGLSNFTVTIRHTLRNALISTVTVIGFTIQLMLSGAIVIETIFFWPGIGYFTTQSILNLDFPSIMATTVVFTLVVIITNLATDLAYGFLDPRLRVK
jgi:peptide/nickel transport system permease protein